MQNGRATPDEKQQGGGGSRLRLPRWGIAALFLGTLLFYASIWFMSRAIDPLREYVKVIDGEPQVFLRGAGLDRKPLRTLAAEQYRAYRTGSIGAVVATVVYFTPFGLAVLRRLRQARRRHPPSRAAPPPG